MPVFELLVYDETEEFDDVPATLTPLAVWLARRPFPLSIECVVGVRLDDGKGQLASERFGRLAETATGCRAAARRLADGRLALLRSATDNPGVYLLLSADDPVRVTWVHERPPCGDPFPFSPGRSFDPPGAPERLLAWAEAEAPRLLSSSGNAARDRALGLHLRVPRGALVADLEAQAALADEVRRQLG